MEGLVDFFRSLMSMPVLASEHGRNVDNLIVYMHWLMLVLFVGWILYFGYVLVRFRKSKNPKADYVGVKSHSSSYIEVAVAVVEMVLLFGLAVPLWSQLMDRMPAESESTVIRVIAQQFGWNARYPGKDALFVRQDANLIDAQNKWGEVKEDPNGKDDFTMFNDLRVPVNKPVIIHLSSLDVIHSFKVIALRVCQDAIPGMNIPLWFTANKVGRYQINCAQLCGTGHYTMSSGFLTVQSQEDFDAWFATQSGGGGDTATSFE
ncbi:MAG: cytochrome c oxidase subunit II [Verrucomicrobia bacterium]|nr:cytochrome c oxidase subunit II [Verrucomicrobiota bacterium]